MPLSDRIVAVAAVGAAAVGLPLGFAVQRTWTSTHTAFALAGVLVVAAIAAQSIGHAFGVALHDRRGQSAPPAIHVGGGSAGGWDPLTAARVAELHSRANARGRTHALEDFGMDAGQIQEAQWSDAQGGGWE